MANDAEETFEQVSVAHCFLENIEKKLILFDLEKGKIQAG